ncbi:hypothetical protein J6590_035214 [Homalodisca vitripennis]|nr:hypothetical protein J6590_035214 [Homalodisca vitripennis]
MAKPVELANTPKALNLSVCIPESNLGTVGASGKYLGYISLQHGRIRGFIFKSALVNTFYTLVLGWQNAVINSPGSGTKCLSRGPYVALKNYGLLSTQAPSYAR